MSIGIVQINALKCGLLNIRNRALAVRNSTLKIGRHDMKKFIVFLSEHAGGQTVELVVI